MKRGVLVGGGRDDLSLVCLVAAAERAGVPVVPVLVTAAAEPLLAWDFASGTLTLDGVPLDPVGAFLRYDVFTPRTPGAMLDRALGWYGALLGWAAARETTRLFNRELSPQAGLKPYQLAVARAEGLAIPATWIGNDLAALRDRAGKAMIAKPVGGGAYTQPLERALADHDAAASAAPIPAIVQERLDYPEYRVFIVGDDTHVFQVASDQLDYRPDHAATLVYHGATGPIAEAVAGCRRVAAALRCDFAACDLKTRPGDGVPVFLEINTGPMFAAFDRAADGAVTASIIDALAGKAVD